MKTRQLLLYRFFIYFFKVNYSTKRSCYHGNSSHSCIFLLYIPIYFLLFVLRKLLFLFWSTLNWVIWSKLYEKYIKVQCQKMRLTFKPPPPLLETLRKAVSRLACKHWREYLGWGRSGHLCSDHCLCNPTLDKSLKMRQTWTGSFNNASHTAKLLPFPTFVNLSVSKPRWPKCFSVLEHDIQP